jgi:hypothetical protein
LCGAAIATSLDAFVDDSIQGTAERWVEEEIGGVANAVTQFASCQERLLDETSSNVDMYVSDEVKKDIPTGMFYNNYAEQVWLDLAVLLKE